MENYETQTQTQTPDTTWILIRPSPVIDNLPFPTWMII
jgi:hypothetical protein